MGDQAAVVAGGGFVSHETLVDRGAAIFARARFGFSGLHGAGGEWVSTDLSRFLADGF